VSNRYPAIIRLSPEKCWYSPRTHVAHATGKVEWRHPEGSGALGTVSVKWTGKGRYSLAATTPQIFRGRWVLSARATKDVSRCAISGTFSAPTAESVIAYLQAHQLPISGVIAYNATTDPNHLLGRPDGYLSKVAWQDSRVSQTGQSADPGGVEWGGSIEVFSDSTRALARANYIGAIAQAAPSLADEYDYVLGPVLLRLSGTLTPAQAASYAETIPGMTEFHYSGPAGTPATTTSS